MGKNYIFQTGSGAKVKTGLLGKIELYYSGMPNENTFALTAIKSKSFLIIHGFKYSIPIYNDIRDKEINVFNYKLKINSVSPKEINFNI